MLKDVNVGFNQIGWKGLRSLSSVKTAKVEKLFLKGIKALSKYFK